MLAIPIKSGNRLFGKGDLKYIILDLLKDQPSYGYELIKKTTEKTGGLYSPSAGSIYPILHSLQSRGLIKSIFQDEKKVFAISEDGRKYLYEREALVDGIKSRLLGWREKEGAGQEAVRDAYLRLGMRLEQQARQPGRFHWEDIKKVLDHTLNEIENVLKS